MTNKRLAEALAAYALAHPGQQLSEVTAIAFALWYARAL